MTENVNPRKKTAVKIANNARVYKKTETWKSTEFGLLAVWCDLIGRGWCETI